MTGTTPGWGLPYPEADTLITDSAVIVQQLAEKIDAALSNPAAMPPDGPITIPGTVVETFTASGTFTPPPGVTRVNVLVVGGGGNGGGSASPGADGGGGGGGGGIRYRWDIPVDGPVAVTVGGPGTATTFGPVTAPGGLHASGITPGSSRNGGPGSGGVGGTDVGNNTGSRPCGNGTAGLAVNAVEYAGGGGGGGGWYAGAAHGGTGGPGGGGDGAATWQPGNTPGTAGTGGGGGGGGGKTTRPGASGGTGRVMVYTEQAYRATREAPAVIDPAIVAGLDDNATMVGAYAVDPAAPVVHGVTSTVPYPDEPVPTGRMVTVPVDPEDPDGPTHEVPEVAWPVAGWTHKGGLWRPPATPKEGTP